MNLAYMSLFVVHESDPLWPKSVLYHRYHDILHFLLQPTLGVLVTRSVPELYHTQIRENT